MDAVRIYEVRFTVALPEDHTVAQLHRVIDAARRAARTEGATVMTTVAAMIAEDVEHGCYAEGLPHA